MSLRHARRAAVVCGLAALVAGCAGDGAAPERTERQFVRSGASSPATVWAIGDAASRRRYRERSVARLITRARPDLLLYLGDVYEHGTREEFKAYDELYGRLASRTAPTAGNHEWPAHEEGYEPYWKERKGITPPQYYSFTLAGWQVISLNSQIFGDSEANQLKWLRRAVSGPGNCRLAFWHEPRYSAGTVHGDEPDMDPLWRSLRGRAALVVNGHEHSMQRMKPRDGIVQVISGAGGHANRYPIRKRDKRLAFADDDHDGALRIRLSPGRARLDFVATNGRVLDSSSVRCRKA